MGVEQPIADRKYTSPITGNDWSVSADDLVQVHLSLALSRHVPDWPGATDEQMFKVAQEIIDALDDTPRSETES